jgi:hypothetical protein
MASARSEPNAAHSFHIRLLWPESGGQVTFSIINLPAVMAQARRDPERERQLH